MLPLVIWKWTYIATNKPRVSGSNGFNVIHNLTVRWIPAITMDDINEGSATSCSARFFSSHELPS
jgi:hypothetical protein